MAAGSTLGLAAVGAALMLALGGTAGTSPAYAITQTSDGTVLIKFNYGFAGPHTLGDADTKLKADYDETILVNEAPGPATVKGPINCTPVTGLDAGAKNPGEGPPRQGRHGDDPPRATQAPASST